MKKHWRWILLLVPVLFLGGFLRWKTRQPEYVLRQFSVRENRALQLNETEQLQRSDCAREHLKTLEGWRKYKFLPIARRGRIRLRRKIPPELLLLRLSWYSNDQYTNEQHKRDYDIDTKGILEDFSSDYGNYGMNERGSEPVQLTQAELQRIQRLITKFPSGVAPAPRFKDILFISYRDGDSWQARVYDRRSLPAPVRDLWKLISIRAKINSQLEKPDQTQ